MKKGCPVCYYMKLPDAHLCPGLGQCKNIVRSTPGSAFVAEVLVEDPDETAADYERCSDEEQQVSEEYETDDYHDVEQEFADCDDDDLPYYGEEVYPEWEVDESGFLFSAIGFDVMRTETRPTRAQTSAL